MTEAFPLAVLAPALESFHLPTGAFDPEGQWEHSYAVHSVGQVGVGRAGTLRLRREPRAGGAALSLEYEKTTPARHLSRITGRIQCRDDSLSTPQTWRFTFESRGPSGDLVENTRIEKTAVARNGHVELRDEWSRRRIPVRSAYTVNWALLDAVQRLPRERFEPIDLTLFDDFDQPKPGLTLSYWKSATVMLGGRRVQQQRWEELARGRIRTTFWAREGDRPVHIHGFSLLGAGTVPWVYWVDDVGRLLVAVAGLEAYVLQTQ